MSVDAASCLAKVEMRKLAQGLSKRCCSCTEMVVDKQGKMEDGRAMVMVEMEADMAGSAGASASPGFSLFAQ